MGILDVYENTIENQNPITGDYLKNRVLDGSGHVGYHAWWPGDYGHPFQIYRTYKIPIYVSVMKIGTPFFNPSPYREVLQIGHMTFYYDFNAKVLKYEIHPGSTPDNYRSDIEEELRGLYRVLGIEDWQFNEDTKPGKIFTNVSTIPDFELIVDSIKQILRDNDFNYTEF